jgi:rhamnogalacturonyl hydrolase YesR
VKNVRTKLFPPDKPADASTPTERAKTSWDALNRGMALPGAAGLYRENPTTLKPATVWPVGQVLAGALDLAQLTGDYKPVDQAMAGLSLYKHGGAYAPSVGGGNKLWDDNAWIGLDFMQAYAQTGNKDYVKAAEAMFPFMLEGLHKDGGLYWEENNPRMTRNTCGNGPAIQYALRLYMATKDEKYLDFAKNLDGFMNEKLRSPEGLYWDNLADNGELGKDIYSYNQGTPIGADVLWYRVTGDKKYLERATQTAQATLDHFAKNDGLWKQAPCFNAILFRNLMALDQVAPNPRYKATMDAYLERGWKEARDPETGLFNQGGIGAYSGHDALDQGGWVQMYALQDWPKDKLLDVA